MKYRQVKPVVAADPEQALILEVRMGAAGSDQSPHLYLRRGKEEGVVIYLHEARHVIGVIAEAAAELAVALTLPPEATD